jgi:hypothetical protein
MNQTLRLTGDWPKFGPAEWRQVAKAFADQAAVVVAANDCAKAMAKYAEPLVFLNNYERYPRYSMKLLAAEDGVFTDCTVMFPLTEEEHGLAKRFWSGAEGRKPPHHEILKLHSKYEPASPNGIGVSNEKMLIRLHSKSFSNVWVDAAHYLICLHRLPNAGIWLANGNNKPKMVVYKVNDQAVAAFVTRDDTIAADTMIWG